MLLRPSTSLFATTSRAGLRDIVLSTIVKISVRRYLSERARKSVYRLRMRACTSVKSGESREKGRSFSNRETRAIRASATKSAFERFLSTRGRAVYCNINAVEWGAVSARKMFRMEERSARRIARYRDTCIKSVFLLRRSYKITVITVTVKIKFSSSLSLWRTRARRLGEG